MKLPFLGDFTSGLRNGHVEQRKMEMFTAKPMGFDQ